MLYDLLVKNDQLSSRHMQKFHGAVTDAHPSHIPLVLEVLAVHIQPAVGSMENLVGAGISAGSTQPDGPANL